MIPDRRLFAGASCPCRALDSVFKLFAVKLSNSINLRCTSCTCGCVEARRRAAKQNIKEAMAHQDIDRLKQAIADASGVLSDSELAHAKKLLDFLIISQGTAIHVYLSYIKHLNRLFCRL